MSTITLSNSKVYNHIGVFVGQANYQGSLRRTLEVRISYDETTFDDLRQNFITENLGEIILSSEKINDSGETIVNQYQHLNYSLVMGLGVETIDETDMWVIRLAQRTDLEIMQQTQSDDINMLTECVLEMSEFVYA